MPPCGPSEVLKPLRPSAAQESVQNRPEHRCEIKVEANLRCSACSTIISQHIFLFSYELVEQNSLLENVVLHVCNQYQITCLLNGRMGRILEPKIFKNECLNIFECNLGNI